MKAWPADRVERRPIGELVPYAKNARTHTPEQIAQLAASMREWGWTNPVLIAEDRTIIAGHARVMAAQSLGFAEVPVMIAAGWSDAQIRAYVLADNKLALNAGWDNELLSLELADLESMGFDLSMTGFSREELARLQSTNALGDPDYAPDPPEAPRSQIGDLWLLGAHRLLCGDSTNVEHVAMLVGDANPRLMVTDPPYGVSLDMEWRDRAGRNVLGKAEASYMKNYNGRAKTLSADVRADWSAAFALVPSIDVAYVWHATAYMIEVGEGLRSIGFDLRQQIVWNKPVMTISRQAYHWKHEPCWYAVRKNATARWRGTRDQTTVWDAAPPKQIFSGSDEQKVDHPTQKPVLLYDRPIENHTRVDEAVYEPFSGSGTAIIACERLKRRAIAMEIDPRFVDVAVKRWEDFTGGKARLERAKEAA